MEGCAVKKASGSERLDLMFVSSGMKAQLWCNFCDQSCLSHILIFDRAKLWQAGYICWAVKNIFQPGRTWVILTV